VSTVLLVEDDPKIGRLLAEALEAAGHTVRWAAGGADGIAAGHDGSFDLVLLDLGLPDVDGIEVCRSLRRDLRDAVIVILTARRDEMDVIVGLESGADDYLTKPFRLTELLARVRAHLRRGRSWGDSVPDESRHGDLVIAVGTRHCHVRGVAVALRAREFDLLARLVAAGGEAVSRETLMADVWDENWFGSTKTLDVHVASVRRKLDAAAADSGGDVPTITTLRGFGYRLDEPGTNNATTLKGATQ
jgi:DNA-binding response OmpR family regulator